MVNKNFYSKFLVCYDIEENKSRTKFFDRMKDIGLVPIQKSVFYGDLNNAEMISIKKIAFELLNPATDKCLIVKCNLQPEQIKQQGIGYSNFVYIEPDGYRSI